jgi:hypothetical protein
VLPICLNVTTVSFQDNLLSTERVPIVSHPVIIRNIMVAKFSLTSVAGIGSILFLLLYLGFGGYLFKGDDIFAGHAVCGTGPQNQGFFSSDFISLYLKNDVAGKATVSGSVNVSKVTYDAFGLRNHPLKLRLEPLQLNYSSISPFFEEVELGGWSLNFEGPHKSAYIDLKPKVISLFGEPRNFPFEQYRYGYKAVLYIETAQGAKDLPFKYVFTIVQLSSFFVPSVAQTTEDYMDFLESPLVTSNDKRTYAFDECAVKIERSFSFKFMVGLLTLFLFFPVTYSLFRTDKQPAVDVIATIVSVAAIRIFLIGPVENFQFYKIDFIFGLAIVLSATVPLMMLLWQRRRV